MSLSHIIQKYDAIGVIEQGKEIIINQDFIFALH